MAQPLANRSAGTSTRSVVPSGALEADLAVVLAVPAVVVDLPLLAQLAVLVPLEVEAELAVEEVSVEALHRSFSAAMVGS